jgi:hypothetical protein
MLLQKQNSSLSRPASQLNENFIDSNTQRTCTITPQSSSNESVLYESKRIVLRLCYVFRRSSSATDLLVLASCLPSNSSAAPLMINGTNGSILDIVLPSTQTYYSVRFVDDMYARRWFYIIHAKISRFLLELLPEIEEHFHAVRHAKEIKACGWLAEQIVTDDRTIKSWRPMFLVVTDAELCFLSSTPLSRQTCREPDLIYPILSTR